MWKNSLPYLKVYAKLLQSFARNDYKTYFTYGWIPEWPKGTDCKSARTAFEGSNPSPPILHMLNLQVVKHHDLARSC